MMKTPTPKKMKPPMMDDDDPFWTAYEELAARGQCDSPGGFEYNRVRHEWEESGKPSNIEEFIVKAASLPAFDVGRFH